MTASCLPFAESTTVVAQLIIAKCPINFTAGGSHVEKKTDGQRVRWKRRKKKHTSHIAAYYYFVPWMDG